MKLAEFKKLPVGFIDPQVICANTIGFRRSDSVEAVARILQMNQAREVLMAVYHTGNHYLLLVISLKCETVWYLDSARPPIPDGTLRPGERDYTEIKGVLDEYISNI